MTEIYLTLSLSTHIGDDTPQNYGKVCFTSISISSLVGRHTLLPTRLLTLMHVAHDMPYQYVRLYRLPEDEPSGSKHAEDVIN